MTDSNQTNSKPKLLVVDDHHCLLDALTFVLSSSYNTQSVDSLHHLDLAIAAFAPEIVILDIAMPDGDGITTAQRLAKLYPDLKLVVLSAHCDAGQIQRSIQAGVLAFVCKRASSDELLEAINTVLRGGRFLSPELRPLLDSNSVAQDQGLTIRQREVLQLIAKGCSAKEIATSLNISVRTAEYHRACIMGRLNLHSTAMMTRYAVEQGMV